MAGKIFTRQNSDQNAQPVFRSLSRHAQLMTFHATVTQNEGPYRLFGGPFVKSYDFLTKSGKDHADHSLDPPVQVFSRRRQIGRISWSDHATGTRPCTL